MFGDYKLGSLVSHLKFVHVIFSPFVCYFIKQLRKDSKGTDELPMMSVKLNCPGQWSTGSLTNQPPLVSIFVKFLKNI